MMETTHHLRRSNNQPGEKYRIIGYPLEATIKTEKLFYCESCERSQRWSFDETEAKVYGDYMEAFRDLMKIKRKNTLFLILIYPKK
jgi:hypothetical protein